MNQFKRGDKVRVRTGLKRGADADGFLTTFSMVCDAGKEFTVAGVRAASYGECITLTGNEWSWRPHLLELVQDQPREFRYALTTGDLGTPKFDSLVAIEDYLVANAACDYEIPIVEIVPVKTIKVSRVIEEVKA